MHYQKTIGDSRPFIRFLVVGILNTAFGYGLFALFISIGLHYVLASFIGTVFGILFNFFSTGCLVFNNKDISRLPWFFGVYGVTYVFGIVGLSILDDMEVDMYCAGLVMIPPSAVVSYFLNRWFVFGGNSEKID